MIVLGLCGVMMSTLAGCKTLSALGFKSRGLRMAEKLQRENLELKSKNEEYKSMMASAEARQRDMSKELKRAKLELTRKQAEKSKARPAVDQRKAALQKLAAQLGGRATPIITPEGNRGYRLSSDILFKSGKAAVRQDARPVLRMIANAVGSVDDIAVFVDGHTDSDPLRVTKKLYSDNYGLGAARANAVATELVSMGVPRTQLVTRTFGPDKPIASNKTASGKKLNRRVEITFALPQVARALKTGR
jgi:flagellar motor protein MotB